MDWDGRMRTRMSSEDFGEMMMVSVPVAWARGVAQSDGQGWSPLIRENCKAALSARKSKYERWRETVETPWSVNCEGEVQDRAGYHINNDNDCSKDQAKLMAAAPQLLEALLLFEPANMECDCDCTYCDACKVTAAELEQVHNAIRAAVPADVAAELLQEQA